MKKIAILFLGMALCLSFMPQAVAQPYGQLRALQQRAETVAKQKNSFVALVLNAYKVPYQVNEQGVVARIQVQGKWHDVSAVEIVPLLINETSDAGSGATAQLKGHEIYFFTPEGILDLTSDLTVH